MDNGLITAVALSIEIVGAFFLSVEAIKLENFRSIRDNIFKHINHATKSPRLVFPVRDDDNTDANQIAEAEQDLRESIEFNEGVWGARHPKLFLGLHYVAGGVLLFLANIFLDGYLLEIALRGFNWAWALPWYYSIPVMIVAFFYIFFAGLWALGEIVHLSVTYATSLPIRLVDFIDKKTPTGGVGMIGFALLFLGGAIQIWLALNSAPG